MKLSDCLLSYHFFLLLGDFCFDQLRVATTSVDVSISMEDSALAVPAARARLHASLAPVAAPAKDASEERFERH